MPCSQDAISYAKGGSVLRMLDNFLTPEVFRQGISHYLKRFSYKNTQTEDLWNALSEVRLVPRFYNLVVQ